jgi:hypothetical protein
MGVYAKITTQCVSSRIILDLFAQLHIQCGTKSIYMAYVNDVLMVDGGS